MVKSEKKTRISKLTDDFLENRKNSNNLVDILNLVKDSSKQIPCILSLERIFIEILKRGDLSEPNEEANENERIFHKWLKDCFEDGLKKILHLLSKGNEQVKNQALITLMKILAAEGSFPYENNDKFHFPVNRLKAILEKLINEKSNLELISKFEEYIQYPDVELYTWHLINLLTKNYQNQNHQFIANLLKFIEKIAIKKEIKEDTEKTYSANLCLRKKKNFKPKPVLLNKLITQTCKNLLRWNYSPELLRQLLLLIVEKFIPLLTFPVFLTDFFMDSMNLGGATGVLGLQGMFLLIQKYNLEYPKIYDKIYTMFNQDIFHTKFKSRLFHLTDIFLSSSHLPEQLVAAYAKKFARLSLIAPTLDILILLSFIGNLLIRHPGLKKMLVATPNAPDIDKDPYDFGESNPYDSNACGSYFWELYNLQNHYSPEVSIQAKKLINDPLPKVEFDLHTYLDMDDQQMFEKQIKKKKAEKIHLTFIRPKSIKLPEGDKMMELWNLD